MENFTLIVIFVVFNLFLLSNAAPKSLDATELRNLSEISNCKRNTSEI